jgi:tRNA threonylcarbamoyladenosine biosynthesis protein TsaB
MDTEQQNLLPLLVIDTSTQVLSLAIRTTEQTYLFHKVVGAKQSEQILPAISQLLHDSHLALSAIKTIVYAKGPGTFTGLRIGLGVAQGLSLPHHIQLMGIPTLDAIAALNTEHQFTLAAMDARMGELFYAWYDNRTHTRLSLYGVAKAEEIITPIEVDDANAQGLGNAYDLPINMPIPGKNTMPTAADYADFALSGRYQPCPTASADILYVRDKIALTAKEQAEQKALKA